MKKIIYLFLILLSTISCTSYKNLMYMQNVVTEEATKIPGYQEIVIQPQDMLSIVVSSKNPELSVPFNLPVVSYQAGGDILAYPTQQRLLGYVVTTKGNIDFPILGELYVAGFTREQLSQKIKEMLISENYINDPVVTVQFLNFKIHVIGEVIRPGTYDINGDHLTLLEALGMAGDLSVYGKRENVKVIREKNGERIIYNIDLRSAELFDSPAYYLQQNDVIYIEPNKYKARQSTNSNQFSQASLWVSIASLFATVIMLIAK